MEKIRVAVIGTGHLGSIHAKLWKNTPNSVLVGIFDTNIETSNKLANELSCKSFKSIDEAFIESDAITISVPTSLHYEIATIAIKKGIHCFIEKPITATYKEAIQLLNTAKNKDTIIQVGHVERFNPALAALKKYSLAPMFIEAHRLSQFKARAIDVSVVHDLMIHDIDIMLSLIKSPVINIDANCVAILTNTPDIANARIKFKNGAVANLTASRLSAHPMRKIRLFQKDAYISIDFGKQDVEVFRIRDDGFVPDSESTPATMLGTIEEGLKNKNIFFEKPIVPQINAIAEEQNAFIDAILEKRPIAVSAEEATEALRIAEEISKQISVY